MPSSYNYAPGELPCSSHSYGLEWIRDRLILLGRTDPMATENNDGTIYVSVKEANVSRNQLLFEMTPPDGPLAVNQTNVNVAPMATHAVTVTGPIGKAVKVRFQGVGFVSETGFTIPGNNNYDFIFGACPAGQRVVTPQMFDFYVEDGSCSPVAVMVTFA